MFDTLPTNQLLTKINTGPHFQPAFLGKGAASAGFAAAAGMFGWKRLKIMPPLHRQRSRRETAGLCLALVSQSF